MEIGDSEPGSSKDLSGDRHPVSRMGQRLRWTLVVTVIASTLVGALAAYLTALYLPVMRGAGAEIIFETSDLNERFLATQEAIIKSRSTLGPIAKTFKIKYKDLADDVDVEVVSNSGMIRLQYRNPDPVLTLDITEAITISYLLSLRQIERIDEGRHRLLTPAYLEEDPVGLAPVQLTVIGAIVGFLIAAAAVLVRTQLWQRD